MQSKYRCFSQTKFIVGRGSIEYLSQIDASKAAVIHGGKSMPDSLKARIEEILKRSGVECRFITKILNEPYFEDIYEVIEIMEEYKPDLLIAIGGGAVMDTAKGIHLFYEHPELSLESALRPYQLPELGATAKMVAIPTTSGTGSETTSAAVFTERKTNRKHLMLSDELIPHFAILDADLTDSLPTSIVVNTGMDALTHAMEASVSITASAMVTTMGISSALDILENLEASTGANSMNVERKTAREVCHVAASLAGVSITNSCAGLAHGFDQPGPWFGLPHGLVCGILLPYTTAFTGVHPSYVKLAKRLGYVSLSDIELCSMLVEHLISFNKLLDLPASFKEAGVEEDEYMAKIDDFAALAVDAIATKLSPRVPTIKEAKKLFRQALYGETPVISSLVAV